MKVAKLIREMKSRSQSAGLAVKPFPGFFFFIKLSLGYYFLNSLQNASIKTVNTFKQSEY